MRKIFTLLLLFFLVISRAQDKKTPVKIAVIGLTHTHVHWILGRPEVNDIEIVAIVEANRELAERYAEQHNFPMSMVFDNVEQMLSKVRPEAVAAFGNIQEHLKVVETFAPLGIHVMVEKPLAVSFDHARKIEQLATKHKIHVFTNYETTWYASNERARNLIEEKSIGDLRKIVVHDGHRGPKEIGVNKEFLDWLTDPALNGGGAITDFGCYGANLITWLSDGQRPVSVTAVLQTLKPEIYPEVDDEATVILTYKEFQGIIQASWNWPISRKDMEVYGASGQIFCDNSNEISTQFSEDQPMIKRTLPDRKYPDNDPFAKFAALIRNKTSLDGYDPSGLKNNMLVMEILEAAKKSARQHKTVFLN